MRQKIPSVYSEQARDEIALNHIFKTDTVIVQGQGSTINFSVPLNTNINEDKLSQAAAIDYKLISFEAVVNQPGMSDHLHVWLRKLAEWERKEQVINAVKAL